MEFRDYWDAIVQSWWVVVILGLVGLAIGLLVAAPHPAPVQPHYESNSIIGSPPTTSTDSSTTDLLGGGITIGQILYYASTDGVLNETNKLSGLNETLPAIRSQISLVAPALTGNTGQSNADQNGVVNVSVTADNAADALKLDQSFIQAMSDYTNDQAKSSLENQEKQTEATLYSILSEIASNSFPPGLSAQALEVQVTALQNYLASLVVQQPGSGLQVVQSPTSTATFAVVKGTPIYDNRAVRALIGLVLGLIVGMLAAMALWLLDKRVKTAKRAQLALGYPVIEIPYESSDSSEAYRMLWLNVFREPLPLPSAEQADRWYDGEDPVLDHGSGGRSAQVGRP